MNITELPEARISPRRRWSWVWVLPLFAVISAFSLIYASWNQRGVPIHLQFQQGHGLKAGDVLRYRGIEIGHVHQVRLTSDLKNVQVEVRLNSSAIAVAREGSRFWIVRPQLSLSGITGLETVVGAHYLTVLPGQGNYQTNFIGLDHPPLTETMEAGGLEIILRTNGRGDLRQGAPVTYRQVVIGTLLSVDLAKDASAVEVRAYIKPNYLALIREGTLFWKTSGAKLSAGWISGLSLEVESVESLMTGGVTIAIPPHAGQPVSSGQVFTLHDKSQPEWLEWVPYLPVNQPYAQMATERPRPLLATLTWKYRNYFKWWQSGQRQGWVLPMKNGLLGPSDLLKLPPDAQSNTTYLTVGEIKMLLGEQATDYVTGLAILPYQHDYTTWPSHRQRFAEQPEDTLIVTDFNRAARFITADHYRVIPPGDWQLDSTLSVDHQWHGACVVAAKDGALLGIVTVEDSQAKVILLPTVIPEKKLPDNGP